MQEGVPSRVSSHHHLAQHEQSAPVAAPTGRPRVSLQPNQGPAVEIGPGNAELSAWLEHVGTLNAIEAIMEAERHRQQALAASSAPTVLAGALHGLDGFGWLADAVSVALQSHLQREESADVGPVTIPLELHLTPTQPRRPHRPTDPSGAQASRWTPVARISLEQPASTGGAPHQCRPVEQPRPTGVAPSREARWTPLGTHQLHSHLHNFLALSATTANLKTAVAGLLAWWKLHELAISDADSGELVGLLHHFIRTWLMQQATPTVLPEPTARTLLPAACAPPAKAELELEPRIYSCNEVAQLHNYQDSTIRRCAIKSWRQGPGHHPLRGIPGFYVVARPNPGCGRGRGWKFQRAKTAAEHDTTRPDNASMDTRLAAHGECRRMSLMSSQNDHHGGTSSARSGSQSNSRGRRLH
jgi:hypothetical protein